MTLFANPVAHRIAFELRPFLTRSRLMYGAVVGGGRNGSPRAWDPPGLVGRAAELAELDAFLNTAAAPARALVLAGGAGVGKTSLWEAAVEMPREFIVPGETRASAALEMARVILRRAERRAITAEHEAPSGSVWIVPYLNRLADLLWVLARAAEQAVGAPVTTARVR